MMVPARVSGAGYGLLALVLEGSVLCLSGLGMVLFSSWAKQGPNKRAVQCMCAVVSAVVQVLQVTWGSQPRAFAHEAVTRRRARKVY